MNQVFDAIKARAAIISLINAVGFFLMTSGKVSQDTLHLWTEQAGKIFDAGIVLFGAIALLVPSIKHAVASIKETKTNA